MPGCALHEILGVVQSGSASLCTSWLLHVGIQLDNCRSWCHGGHISRYCSCWEQDGMAARDSPLLCNPRPPSPQAGCLCILGALFWPGSPALHWIFRQSSRLAVAAQLCRSWHASMEKWKDARFPDLFPSCRHTFLAAGARSSHVWQHHSVIWSKSSRSHLTTHYSSQVRMSLLWEPVLHRVHAHLQPESQWCYALNHV